MQQTVPMSEMTVLMVDDEYFIRATMRQLLYQIGLANVEEAADGASGLLKARLSKPHLVICEIHMPVLDGFTFVNELRTFCDAPVILLTSDHDEKTVVMAKKLKVDGYLIKPMSFAAVQRAVERALKL